MNIKNLILFIGIGCCIYFISLFESGCAQIGAVTGGPRDTIPPVLLTAAPPDGTIHFKGNRIIFNFDEYVQIPKLQDNLLISPTPKIPPNVDSKFKTITVRIRDTLEPNTTYRYDFGNAIQDINEGNILKNFTYIFSTGSYIDSLYFSGNVQLAETGKIDTTLYVFLYKDLSDSAVYKHKPRYITRVNNKGDFTFHNLAAGTYNVFALKDEGGQRIYNNKDEIFAFADNPIHAGDTTKPVALLAYAEEKTLPKTSSIKAVSKDKKLKFTTSISNGTQDLLSPLTLEFSNPLKNFDSLKIQLTDTLFHPFQSATVSLDTTGKKVFVKNSWLDNTDYRLIISKDFATDTLGVALSKSDTIHFKSKKESEYGSITLNFKNLSKYKNPVLQFVSNNEIAESYPLTSPKWSVKLFKPGDYELRILEDRNHNGIWDPGSYHLKLQPEKVYSISQKLNIRGDWDNERDIEL
jgi:uncharacterized protein (DUF2141 family)